jgi:hypothetical protein
MNFFDKAKVLIILTRIYWRLNMRNWKTTLMGCIAAVATYLATVDWTDPVALKTSVVPIVMVIWGVVQKDSNVTGGTIHQ